MFRSVSGADDKRGGSPGSAPAGTDFARRTPRANATDRYRMSALRVSRDTLAYNVHDAIGMPVPSLAKPLLRSGMDHASLAIGVPSRYDANATLNC